ncbi:MAG TPA: ROK family protein [Ktedonobacterales bacterium]|jgi:predicted NBD/HSP70 family sugar kinase|nr:ROK family protein [Ktedonobacterales bacterium]
MYIAIDVGGSWTRIGVFETPTSTSFEQGARFPTEQLYNREMELLVEAITATSVPELRGIGISLGARIARDGRDVLEGPNLRDYEHKPIVRELERHFGCLVRLAHDPVCGILAETTRGVLQPFDRCAYLTVSTGTGAAIQLRKPPNVVTLSIEMGHQIMPGNTRKCLCGQIGCVETYTGGKQIALRYGREASEITDPAFWREFTDVLAVGIVNLSWLTRVEAIALSGGIALQSAYLREHLQERVNALRAGDECRLLWSQLGENAPIIGAALLIDIPESTILH